MFIYKQLINILNTNVSPVNNMLLYAVNEFCEYACILIIIDLILTSIYKLLLFLKTITLKYQNNSLFTVE